MMFDSYIEKVKDAMPDAIAKWTDPVFQYCIDNTWLTFILLCFATFLAVILVVIIALSVKASKAKKALRKAQAENNAQAPLIVEEPKAENQASDTNEEIAEIEENAQEDETEENAQEDEQAKKRRKKKPKPKKRRKRKPRR